MGIFIQNHALHYQQHNRLYIDIKKPQNQNKKKLTVAVDVVVDLARICGDFWFVFGVLHFCDKKYFNWRLMI